MADIFALGTEEHIFLYSLRYKETNLNLMKIVKFGYKKPTVGYNPSKNLQQKLTWQ